MALFVSNGSVTTGFNQVVKNVAITTIGGTYSLNDRISDNAVTFAPTAITGMALANGRGGVISMLRLTCNVKSMAPVIRLHFFNATDPALAVDNAQWKELYADDSKRVGYYDMPAMSTAADTTNSNCSRTQDVDVRLPFVCAAASTSLWVAMELIGGTTALTSVTEFTLVVKAELN